MPDMMDGEFYGPQFSVAELDQETYHQLEDFFNKLLPDDAPGDHGEKMRPSYMKNYFEKSGFDKENPSMYAMICWMTKEASIPPIVDGITFDQFISQAIYFFNQRHSQQGLKYIFELFDTKQDGFLDHDEFMELLEQCEIHMSEEVR